MSARRARRFVGVLAVAAAASSPGLSAGAAAAPVPGELQGECPTVMPLAEVATGLRGTALSVTSGRDPVTLDVEALGILRDAVGPGRDVIVVNLSGSAVSEAGGLWYGASGSPVFFRDAATGKYELAGAIAYGLAGGASTLAGLTPAEEMTKLLALDGPAPATTSSIAVPRRLATRMSAASGLSLAQVASLARLRTPLSASGLTDRGLRRMQQAIDRQGLPYFAYAGSSATESPSPPTGQLRAGDSFAAVLSVGDVTVGGVGTTTLVCEGRVLAFGHPMTWTGETTLGARAADTITIVEDPLWGSYKLANIAESVGVVTQDRLAGIVGRVGVAPPTSPITSTVTDLDTGRMRTGRSEAIMPEFLPFLSFEHLFTNVDVTIDRIGPGNAEMAYVIRGTREGGAPWELVRSSHYASPWDISFEAVWEPAFTAEILQGFEAEEIVVTSMEVPRLDVEQAFEQYRLRRVLVWNGSEYVARRVARARAGKAVRLRAVLDPAHRAGTESVDLTVRVPANARRNGYVTVTGGASSGPEIPCFFGELEAIGEECGGPSGGLTFDELLAAFEEQPRGDVVFARLWLGGSAKPRASASKRLDAVVSGHRVLSFRLRR